MDTSAERIPNQDNGYEIFYNHQRLYSVLGHRTPAEARTDMSEVSVPMAAGCSDLVPSLRWGEVQSQRAPEGRIEEYLDMHTALLAACCLALGLALPVAAQQTQVPGPPAAASNQASGGNQALTRTKVQKDLEQAGFTDVQVTPESFFVRARNKEGQPVMMIIEPNSIAAVVGASASGTSSAQPPTGTQDKATAGTSSGLDLATGKHDAP